MRFFATVLIIIALVTACGNREDQRYLKPTLAVEAYDPHTPILWGYGDSVIIKGFKDSALFKRNHPLDIGRHALYVLHRASGLKDSLNYISYLEYLKEYPYRVKTNNAIVYAYGFNHHDFKKGEWWSAMANSTIALAFWKGFKASNDSSYYKEFELALNGVLNSTSENGCALHLSDSATWYLEYAENSTGEKDAYFVLNGFLYALVNLNIIAQETGRADVQDAYDRGVSGFVRKRKSYYYDSVSWTKYMLYPVTVEPAHYAIFDVLLFESLKELDSAHVELWENEITWRRAILKRAYPVIEKDDNTLFFSVLGPPHPYWLDTYPVTLSLSFTDGFSSNYHVKSPRDLAVDLSTRAFHYISIPEEKKLQRIDVYSVYAKDSVLLYTTKEPGAFWDTLSNQETQLPWKLYSGDAQMHNQRWMLNFLTDSVLSHTDFAVQLPSRLAQRDFFYGFLLNPAFEVKSLRILFIDNSGNSAERYYQLPGKEVNNFILFHPTGFKSINELDFSKPVTVRVMIYHQSTGEEAKWSMELGDLRIFENSMEVSAFMRVSEVQIPEKTKKGNIY